MRNGVGKAACGLVLVLGLWACASDADPELEVLYAPTAAAPLSSVRVELSGAAGPATLMPEDFTTSRYGTPHSDWIDVRPGEARVRVIVSQNPTVALAEGTVVIPIERDQRYSVTATISSNSPEGECLGCRQVVAFPLTRPGANERDSLFVSWGSGSISNPVVH